MSSSQNYTHETSAKSSEEIAQQNKGTKEVEKYKGDFNQFFLSDTNVKPPSINFDSCLINGKIEKWTGKMSDIYSPIFYSNNPTQKIKLGIY